MKRTRIFALALAFALMFSMASFAKAEDTVKIGLIAPLTGNVAVYGNAVKNAVDLYTAQFNAAGGVNGKQIEIIAYDDKGDANEAMNAYNRLVYDDGIVALIGPVTSAPTFGVAQASVADNIPCITGTATHPDVTTYGDNFFRACFEDPYQGGTMARFAKNELTAGTAAIIYNTSDAYSTGLMEAFTAEAEAQGLKVVATEGYAASDIDFKSQLTNIAATTPDVLFIPDYYNTCYLIATQARELGITGTFLGVDGTDGVLEIEGADVSVFSGMYFANHYSADDDSEMVQSFISAYEEMYGAMPNALAALGYDAAMILYDALKVCDAAGVDLSSSGDPTEAYQPIIDAMFKTSLDCVTGHITFSEDNNSIKEVCIITINEGKYEFVTKY